MIHPQQELSPLEVVIMARSATNGRTGARYGSRASLGMGKHVPVPAPTGAAPTQCSGGVAAARPVAFLRVPLKGPVEEQRARRFSMDTPVREIAETPSSAGTVWQLRLGRQGRPRHTARLERAAAGDAGVKVDCDEMFTLAHDSNVT